MLISYINKHDQKTKDSYFCNVQYGKDMQRQIFINYFLNKKKSENIERELDTLLTCANQSNSLGDRERERYEQTIVWLGKV